MSNDDAFDEDDQETLKTRLAGLRAEHGDLDAIIARLSEHAPFDQIQIQRLKKKKLRLKDMIQRLEDRILPDIIA